MGGGRDPKAKAASRAVASFQTIQNKAALLAAGPGQTQENDIHRTYKLAVTGSGGRYHCGPPQTQHPAAGVCRPEKNLYANPRNFLEDGPIMLTLMKTKRPPNLECLCFI